MRKVQQNHPAKFPGFDPHKCYMLDDEFAMWSRKKIPRSFTAYAGTDELKPLIAPLTMLSVEQVAPEDIEDGQLVAYRHMGGGLPCWHVGFAEVRPKTVTLMMLRPYGRQEFTRMHHLMTGGKPIIHPEEVMLRVVQVHTMNWDLTLDKFCGRTGLLLLASGIGTEARKKKARRRAA